MSSQNGLSTQVAFQEDPINFSCGPPNRQIGGDPGPKTTTRELIDHKLFSASSNFPPGADFSRSMYRESRDWNSNGNGTSGDDSDEDDQDDDDDDDDDDDRVEGEHNISNKRNNNNSINAAPGTSKPVIDKIIGTANGKLKQGSAFVGEVVVVKDGNASVGQTAGTDNTNNAVTIAEPDGEIYYSPYLQASEGSGSGGKDIGVLDNDCGFSGRKDGSSFSSDSGDSLRAILSDPVTGALMDDAMILPCGHSFGGDGIQHVIKMKACYTCSQSVTGDSFAPNLSLRTAVQAFRQEEELQFYRSSKRKRERFDQGGFGDLTAMDAPRGRGVQFPFSVADRVIIKGNKRTPQRFVGREAVVTTQCLNGWYVVKTLDNAESVKLQYRSLAKVSNVPSANAKMPPNWL